MSSVRLIARTLLPYLVIALIAAPLLGAYEPLSVSGASMQPALFPGDLVFVKRGAQPQADSIALIREAGRMQVLHRVVDVRSDGSVTTRGDANPVDDLDPVPLKAVAGTVRAVLPVGGLLAALRGSGGHATLSAQSNSMKR